MNKTYNIFAFRAIDEPNLCERYLEGHVKVLTDYGITNITSNNRDWLVNSNVYCIGLKDCETNKLLGGIRVQLADGCLPLPVEDAIGHLDRGIYIKINHYALSGGVGELSGLWVDNSLKGVGMGAYLVRASISSTSQLRFKTLIGICAGYSLKLFNQVGFEIDKTMGENGNFPYPNEKYLAHVVGILNARTLERAFDCDKKIMQSLRDNPQQIRTEVEGCHQVKIAYDLKYPTVGFLIYNKNKLIKKETS